MLNAAKPEFAYKKATLTPVKAKKGSALNAGILQLQIRAGKQAKIRAVDIVGSLCGTERYYELHKISESFKSVNYLPMLKF